MNRRIEGTTDTIVTVPAAILQQQAHPLAHIDKQTATLARAMLRTLRRAAGIGLAGPQFGVQLRLFVVQLPDDKARVFVNPTILEASPDTSWQEEGCLSIPGIYAEVERPNTVRVEAWNERGKRFDLDAHGLLARVVQHEYDHLEGILFWDRLNSRRRERLMRQYERRSPDRPPRR